ncbi:hypothetical protein RHS01_10398 [Rhizoctonia solani]|uniref:Transmembrane protein n=1 Tax=Rhizoctonia solani TaxID=456999 RepID=A0A8H7I1S8_9AGAM|nr:hypothetical protein RHS01_10398 [Rhizoctonia solani]
MSAGYKTVGREGRVVTCTPPPVLLACTPCLHSHFRRATLQLITVVMLFHFALIALWLVQILFPVIDHVILGNLISGFYAPPTMLLPKRPPILRLDGPNLYETMEIASPRYKLSSEGLFAGIHSSATAPFTRLAALADLDRSPPVPRSLQLANLCEHCSSASARSAVAPLTRIDAKTGAVGTSQSGGRRVEGSTLELAVSTGSLSSSADSHDGRATSQSSVDPLFTPQHRRRMIRLINRLKEMERSGNPLGRPYDTGSWSDLSDAQAGARTPESGPNDTLSTTVSQDDLYELLGDVLGVPDPRLTSSASGSEVRGDVEDEVGVEVEGEGEVGGSDEMMPVCSSMNDGVDDVSDCIDHAASDWFGCGGISSSQLVSCSQLVIQFWHSTIVIVEDTSAWDGTGVGGDPYATVLGRTHMSGDTQGHSVPLAPVQRGMLSRW